MTRPLHTAANTIVKPTHGDWHKGLWYERFVDIYRVHGQTWEIPKPGDAQQGPSKNDWIETVTGLTGNARELERQAIALIQRVQWLGGTVQGFKSDWHFATGLGNPHPVENGFLWHPTLGVPYLPGASVKGLVRAWVEHWDDSLTPDAKTARCRDWFGTEAKDKVPEQIGQLIFFDALPVERVTLVQDVMTPHYGDWYEKGSKIKTTGDMEQAPADWHDPVPVPFLVVKNAHWLFAIAPRNPENAAAATEAMQALQQALEWLGAGAKTAVGYGRMLAEKHEEPVKALREKAVKVSVSAEQQRILAFEKRITPASQGRGRGHDLYQKTGQIIQEAAHWPAEDRKQLRNVAEKAYKHLGIKEADYKKLLRPLQ